MAKLTVKDVDLKGKKVLVRVDFNVPVKDGVITNDNRITAALPTIKYILEQGGRAILFSHLGRVKEEADKEGKSLAPVAADLAAKLGQDVKFIPGVTRGAELEAAVNALEDGQVLLVENTRFEDVDGKKESKNDPELGKYWASLGCRPQVPPSAQNRRSWQRCTSLPRSVFLLLPFEIYVRRETGCTRQ